MSHQATITCPECDARYRIVAEDVESVQYCPFCGAVSSLPYDDVDTGDEEQDDEDAEDY